MTKKQTSIKKSILQKAVIPIVIATLIAITFSLISSQHEIEEIYDAQLVHSARFLAQLIESDEDKEDLKKEITNIEHKYETNIAFRIFFDDREITASSAALKFTNITPPIGFSNQELNGEMWRFFVFVDNSGRIKVETSEKLEIRHELVNYLVISSITPTILLIAFILLAIWWGTDKGIKPLEALSKDVKHRNADNFSPVDINRAPIEVSPLISSFNSLLSKIQDNFRREKEFTDHAAHELRTPLAAIKTQTQVLIKKLGSNSPHIADLENLNTTIDRSTRLIEQLLSFARMQNKEFSKTDVNISQILDDIIESYKEVIKDKKIKLNKEIGRPINIKGNGEALSILIRNIIDNAIKYNNYEGSIDIISKDDYIYIADTGCGIPDNEKSKVFERFYRVNKSNQIGSGLGLSIVEYIAKTHKIKIEISDNLPKGTVVKIIF